MTPSDLYKRIDMILIWTEGQSPMGPDASEGFRHFSNEIDLSAIRMIIDECGVPALKEDGHGDSILLQKFQAIMDLSKKTMQFPANLEQLSSLLVDLKKYLVTHYELTV